MIITVKVAGEWELEKDSVGRYASNRYFAHIPVTVGDSPEELEAYYIEGTGLVLLKDKDGNTVKPMAYSNINVVLDAGEVAAAFEKAVAEARDAANAQRRALLVQQYSIHPLVRLVPSLRGEGYAVEVNPANAEAYADQHIRVGHYEISLKIVKDDIVIEISKGWRSDDLYQVKTRSPRFANLGKGKSPVTLLKKVKEGFTNEKAHMESVNAAEARRNQRNAMAAELLPDTPTEAYGVHSRGDSLCIKLENKDYTDKHIIFDINMESKMFLLRRLPLMSVTLDEFKAIHKLFQDIVNRTNTPTE